MADSKTLAHTSQANGLKLGYLSSEYPGISHTFIFREIKTLREQGISVFTASIRKPAHIDKMTSEEKKDSQNTIYIKSSSIPHIIASHRSLIKKSFKSYLAMLAKSASFTVKAPHSVLKGIGYFIEAGILLSWMHKTGLNHVHVHFANPAATVAMVASCFGTISFSVSVHGPDIFYNVDTALLVQKVKRAKRIRCISLYCRSQLMRIIPYSMWEKLDIVRCGIDPDTFSPRPEPDNEIPEILCVGRLVPAKGQHILLSACGLLKKRGIQFSLVFVGDGEDRPSLEHLAQQLGINNQVTFTGAIGQDQVVQYYNRADIFALVSFAEGVPVVLMESMAKQVPCVSTNITGIPELIENSKTGMLLQPSDVKGLAHALEILIADKELRIELGKQGRTKVIEYYNLSANCRMMAGFFKNFL
ncbi:glycosyltransferase family 4 protein [Desulfobacter vibrioformis]|uniref:glycosyltransferase family 4 protein n=1 Tax=Desulfobacter vibrioformis TaxID=34031 RepID=UPI000550DE8F|nr:glycosyltransferase family 4 protein [Desulfobacter vibrioformis]